MHLLTIQIQQLAQPLVCRYKAAAAARERYASVTKAAGPSETEGEYTGGFLQFADDYGHDVAFWSSHVTHVGLIDLEQDLAAQSEIAVTQARVQQRTTHLVNNDPAMRLTSMLGGAGQILS